ncbi:RNA 2'-phosphotransferase [Pseudomonas nicosulfuronedens]
MDTKQLNEASKFLSYVLRHKPQAIGLKLDSEGWADISDLITGAEKKGLIINIEIIKTIVTSSDKRRFSVSDDDKKIRAIQGHSTPTVAIQHLEKEPPEFLYHGTASRFLNSIKAQGLTPGARHYVHLSQDEQTAIEVGKRYGKPVVLKIEALRMHQQGFKFFMAENEIWLSDQIPFNFIIIN